MKGVRFPIFCLLGVHTIQLTALSTLHQNEYCMLLYLHFPECLYFLVCVFAPQNIPSSCLFLLGPPLPYLQPKLPALPFLHLFLFFPIIFYAEDEGSRLFQNDGTYFAKLHSVAFLRSVIFTQKLNYLPGF